MTRTEQFTVLASIIALVVSGTTFYYQFLLENNEISISALSTNGAESVSADVVVINKGNKQAAILHASIARLRWDEQDATFYYDSWSPQEWDASLPTTINPDSIKLLHVNSGKIGEAKDLYESADTSNIDDFDEYPNVRRISYGFEITTLSSRGKTEHLRFPLVNVYIWSSDSSANNAEFAGFSMDNEASTPKYIH